jgi:hypothetical protein
VELIDGEKNETHAMYFTKLRDGSKRVTNFQNDCKWFLKWYDGGGENGLTQKKEFEVKMFFSSKDFHPYPHVRLFGAFSLFFSILLFLFFQSSVSLFEDEFRDF